MFVATIEDFEKSVDYNTDGFIIHIYHWEKIYINLQNKMYQNTCLIGKSKVDVINHIWGYSWLVDAYHNSFLQDSRINNIFLITNVISNDSIEFCIINKKHKHFHLSETLCKYFK